MRAGTKSRARDAARNFLRPRHIPSISPGRRRERVEEVALYLGSGRGPRRLMALRRKRQREIKATGGTVSGKQRGAAPDPPWLPS